MRVFMKTIELLEDKEEIIQLWQEGFGDPKEEILYFLENCSNKFCLAYKEENKPLSMLFLVEANLNGEETEYVYGATSSKAARNKGYMSELIKFIQKKYNRLCLIPASESLIEFYEKRHFIYSHPIEALKFNQTKEIVDYLFDGYNFYKPVVLEYRKEA